jgi:hypothetical protein
MSDGPLYTLAQRVQASNLADRDKRRIGLLIDDYVREAARRDAERLAEAARNALAHLRHDEPGPGSPARRQAAAGLDDALRLHDEETMSDA